MLIGGDDISNDAITLGTCFSMFVYNRPRFRFALIGENLTAQSTGSHRRIGGRIQIPESLHKMLRILKNVRKPKCSTSYVTVAYNALSFHLKVTFNVTQRT